jgi:hypothetical protein
MHRHIWSAARIVAVMIVLSGYSPLVWGQESSEPPVPEKQSSNPPLTDKLMVRGGWAYAFGVTANAAVSGPVLGLGTSLDFTNTLGGDTSTDAFRVDTLYRFNDRHAAGFSWYRIGLSGEKVLSREIQVGDNVYDAGATTQSGLSLNIFRLLYDYTFYRNDKVELAVSPGLYFMQTKFSFAGQGVVNGIPGNAANVNEQVTLPLPSIGLVGNYNITPKLQFQNRYDFFYLEIGDYTGAMFEFYAGLEYRLFRHFAMGAAYDRLQAGLRGNGDQGFNVNFSYNLAYVYGTLYLF